MRDTPRTGRNRAGYFVLTVAAIVLGIASRRLPILVPGFLGKYPGDVLWTVMVLTFLGALFPRARSGILALSALITSFTVEFTQLYQAAWINEIRSTFVGHLILGSGFGWGDLLAYTVGASVALGIESLKSRFTP
jgi:hypothetical protein